MVMGDALAMGLLALRGFSPQDFALFHPGGTLGKQLYLRVKDIFPQNAKPQVHIEDNLNQTILEMTSKRLGMTVVVDNQEEVVGIITDGDLRRMLETQQDFSTLKAYNIMSSSPKTIKKNTLAVKALDIMTTHNITQLVVVDKNKYLGVVHLHDLIKEGLV
jgi:arabinose-5-phosphate isomerase